MKYSEPIHRTEYRIVVYSEGPLDVSADDAWSDPFDLKAIDYAITEGDCIGNVEVLSISVVPDDEVQGKLLEIGNDGMFFTQEEEEDGEHP